MLLSGMYSYRRARRTGQEPGRGKKGLAPKNQKSETRISNFVLRVLGQRDYSLMHIFNRLIDREPPQPQSDLQLLQRFGDHQDQAAFGLIVKRHGQVVQRICHGMRLDDHDAEDVFQSTFLVIAKNALSLQREQSLAPFVHLTASRFALQVLRFGRRRRLHEKAAAKPESQSTGAGTEAEISLRESQGMVDSKLAALPDEYRVPLILHFLEGMTHDEVARQLGMPRRTVSFRIQRGTELLRKRLAKKGVEISAVMLAVMIGSKAEAAIAPAHAAAIAKSAALFVTGKAPASAATLMASSVATGVSKVTGPAKVTGAIKLWMSKTAVVVLVGGACAGIVYETRPTPRPPSGFGSSPSALPAPMPSGPIVVRGRILDEEGQPVPEAHVALLAPRGVRGEHGQHDDVVLQGQAGVDGGFALEIPQDFPIWVPGRDQAKLLAFARGHALGSATVNLRIVPLSSDIRLGASDKVRGQVVDTENRPVAGVAVHVVGVGPVGHETIQGADDPRPDPLTGWPQPVITDHEGHFAIAGLDLRQGVRLEVRDERFARQLTVVGPADGRAAQRKFAVESDDLTIKLAPLQMLEGQVLAAGTSKPVPFARLSMIPCETPEGLHPEQRIHVDARADAHGRYRIQPLPGGKFYLFACGQDNDPYLTVVLTVTWQPGTVRSALNLVLPRGIPVRGKVVEADTGLPVYGAQVEYTRNLTTNDVPRDPEQPRLAGGATAFSAKDGRFFIPALPGHGVLRVSAVRATEMYQMCASDKGGRETATPAFAREQVELAATCPGTEVRLVVRRAGRLSGRVVDGVGQPVSSATLITAGEFAYSLFRAERRFQVGANGFLVAQVGVEDTFPVVLIDAAHKYGLSTSLTASVQDRLPTFRLEPCGSAVGDLTSQNGRGLGSVPIELTAVLTFQPAGKPAEETEANWYRNLNRDEPGETAARGRFVLPALVPGLRYRLYAGAGSSRKLVKEFTVEPGQKLQLGSVAVTN